jgi:hypothetical protein
VLVELAENSGTEKCSLIKMLLRFIGSGDIEKVDFGYFRNLFYFKAARPKEPHQSPRLIIKGNCAIN